MIFIISDTETCTSVASRVKLPLPLPKVFFSYFTKNEEFIREYETKENRNTERCKLMEIKNAIDNYDIKDWDKSKKMANPYELIYMPSRKIRHESIANIDPLSRSYFKMWEMLFHHSFLPGDSRKSCILNIAEGPGGFIEALVNYRKRYHNAVDTINAITLKSTNKEIPGWDKAYQFLIRNQNVKIHYGADNTGNIYSVENIKHLRSYIHDNNELATLITADGGFDYSKNFNKQEVSSFKIIFCEIVTAISNQAIGGSFICKLFDTYSNISKSFIHLLSSLYKTVLIHKPVTSRPANSEKYVICKGFRGIREDYLEKLFITINLWNIVEGQGGQIRGIFNSEIPNNINKKIDELNTKHYLEQKQSIEKTISLIKNKPNLTQLNQIIAEQVTYAKQWCKKYEVPVNIASTFLEKKN
jgi:23S rRNA U2552 (ribose-2'-O)-methylase RlmE/FtsJ